MADSCQFDFRIKFYVLELDTIPLATLPTTTTMPTTSSDIARASTTPAAAATDYVTRIIDTFEISHSDISYRAEGNANIVLAMPQRCQVLRLLKNPKRLFDCFV